MFLSQIFYTFSSQLKGHFRETSPTQRHATPTPFYCIFIKASITPWYFLVLFTHLFSNGLSNPVAERRPARTVCLFSARDLALRATSSLWDWSINVYHMNAWKVLSSSLFWKQPMSIMLISFCHKKYLEVGLSPQVDGLSVCLIPVLSFCDRKWLI